MGLRRSAGRLTVRARPSRGCMVKMGRCTSLTQVKKTEQDFENEEALRTWVVPEQRGGRNKLPLRAPEWWKVKLPEAKSNAGLVCVCGRYYNSDTVRASDVHCCLDTSTEMSLKSSERWPFAKQLLRREEDFEFSGRDQQLTCARLTTTSRQIRGIGFDEVTDFGHGIVQ